MLKSPRKAKLPENVASSSWVTNGSSGGNLHVAVGSAFTGIYDRPDLGIRDLRRLSAVLAGTTNYELILVDCPPSLNGLTRMAWSASDRVVLVAEPGLFSVAGTERTMRAIQLFRQEFAPHLAPAGIVANRVRTGSAEHTFRLSEMESMFGELLLTPHIPEQANWQQIQGAAHSVHHWPGDSAKNSAKLFDALLQSLLQGQTGSRNRQQR
jgi:cellulose biosynthesis protein BcsQ